MLHILLCVTLLLLELHVGVHGYMIDAGCGSDTQYVQDRIDTAFRLMANTVTELNKNPINPNIDNLHNALFTAPWDNSKLGNIKQKFESLARISQHNNVDQTIDGPVGEGITDVRFYCTVDRIEKRLDAEKHVQYFNKERNIVYGAKDLTSPGGSYANCFDIKESTMMITLTFAKTKEDNSEKFTEIQICPWFLRKARGFKFKDLADFKSSAFTALSQVAIPVMALLKFRPIDMFVLVDKMIVHELTHTPQALYPTIDMEPEAYGWKNARNLATRYSQNTYAQYDPMQNADSVALFAVGTWILSQPGAPPIGLDGSFTKPQATPKARI